ncbi:DNA endonuclease SmrA [Halomonas cibimaris]|uniref:DNA endonuclease SmrA n=1 Tax=Halomonas cibimaris TaxID=657012 RepID=A0ABP7LWM7_9GAMM
MSQPLRDQADFAAMVGEVTPLKRDNRADPGKAPPDSADAGQARRDAAEQDVSERNFLSDDFVELLAPNDPMAYRQNGIQQGVADRLRHGGYPAQAQLHLLRLPLTECRRQLFAFIEEAGSSDLRAVLIVHGRGREIDSPANVLRSYIAKWLPQFDRVQAYASAQPADGGLGATWVMLRKSPRARANNRERQQKRRG